MLYTSIEHAPLKYCSISRGNVNVRTVAHNTINISKAVQKRNNNQSIYIIYKKNINYILHTCWCGMLTTVFSKLMSGCNPWTFNSVKIVTRGRRTGLGNASGQNIKTDYWQVPSWVLSTGTVLNLRSHLTERNETLKQDLARQVLPALAKIEALFGAIFGILHCQLPELTELSAIGVGWAVLIFAVKVIRSFTYGAFSAELRVYSNVYPPSNMNVAKG